MKATCLVVSLAAVLVPPTTPDSRSNHPAEITTRVLRIAEKRIRDEVENDSFAEIPTTTFTLEFQGADLEGVTHWFGLKLTAAQDDVGTDLRVDRFGQDAGGESPEAIDRDHMWFGADEQPTDRLKLDLDLGPTPRKATELKRLAGTVTMRRATLETATIGGISKRVGKRLEHPLLKDRGVTIDVEAFGDGSIELKIRGELAAVTGFGVVDAAGNDLEAGSSYWSSGDEKSLTLSEDRIDERSKLVFKVATASEDFAVPFEVKGLKLP